MHLRAQPQVLAQEGDQLFPNNFLLCSLCTSSYLTTSVLAHDAGDALE